VFLTPADVFCTHVYGKSVLHAPILLFCMHVSWDNAGWGLVDFWSENRRRTKYILITLASGVSLLLRKRHGENQERVFTIEERPFENALEDGYKGRWQNPSVTPVRRQNPAFGTRGALIIKIEHASGKPRSEGRRPARESEKSFMAQGRVRTKAVNIGDFAYRRRPEPKLRMRASLNPSPVVELKPPQARLLGFGRYKHRPADAVPVEYFLALAAGRLDAKRLSASGRQWVAEMLDWFLENGSPYEQWLVDRYRHNQNEKTLCERERARPAPSHSLTAEACTAQERMEKRKKRRPPLDKFYYMYEATPAQMLWYQKRMSKEKLCGIFAGNMQG
jgi:hypothetical protein